MAQEKLILIGCDDAFTLSALLKSMQSASAFPNHIISATRIADLTGIVRSLEPDLVLLCFRSNQQALNDIHSLSGKVHIPVVCISKGFENETLRWGPACSVFPFQLEHLHRHQYLAPVINSILRSRELPVQTPMVRPAQTGTGSLAEQAMQRNNPDNNRNLSRYVMELDQKAEVLSKVKERIAELYKQVDDPTRIELTSIVNAIKMSSNNSKLWDDFKLYFEQTDPNFLWLLAQKYPDLTPIDLKYCCYIKMNMSNDDIGNLLGINQESVRTHKYRLKKKMSLDKDQDLRKYLRSVDLSEN